MRHKVTCAAVAALVALGTGAEAQEAATGMMMDRRVSRFDLGVYVGGSVTSDWYRSRLVRVQDGETTDAGGEQSYRPGYAPVAGLTATYWATPVFGLRAHGAYAPMRQPFPADGTFDVFDEELGDRSRYHINTYLYDLSLALRPFAMNDARWLSGVYLWAGGGGVTANVAGDGNGLGCEANALSQGACLPYEVEHATVGQGTVGAGMDFFPVTNALSLFGELGFHIYDSPVHVGEGWLAPLVVPTGGTARIADDRTAVTGRLVIGLKALLGNQIEPLPVVVPAPLPTPEPVVPALPPTEDIRQINVCVVENGQLREVQAQYNATRGDTTVNGQAFSTAYPSTTGYAAGATWYINSDVITVGGQRYVKFGLPRVLGVNEVTRTTDFQGVPVFAETGATGTPDIIYVPVRTGCEFQPYQREQKVRNVRG